MWLSYQVNEMNGYVLSTTIHTYTAFFLSIPLEHDNPQWYKVVACNCLVQKESPVSWLVAELCMCEVGIMLYCGKQGAVIR